MTVSREANWHRFVVYYLNFARENQLNYINLSTEHEQILRATSTSLEHKDWVLLTELVLLLGDYWRQQGYWEHYRKFASILLERSDIDDGNRINLLQDIALIEEGQGRYNSAQYLLEQELALLETFTLDKRDRVDETLQKIVTLANFQGDYGRIIKFSKKRLLLARELGNRKREVDVYVQLATASLALGDEKTAAEYCRIGLTTAQELGYTIGIIDMLAVHASVREYLSMLEEGLSALSEALYLATKTGDRHRVNIVRDAIAKMEKNMAKKVFISYNHHDRGFVEKLANDLKNRGVAVWWDEWEINVGDSIIQKVSDGIKSSSYLIVVLSPYSVQSNWVQREIGSALMRQLSKDRSIIILPLIVADCEIPLLLSEINWADFRNDYKLGLKRLIRSLS